MNIRLIAPVEDEIPLNALLDALSARGPQAPFSDSHIDCCVRLSRSLFADREARAFPALQALAFWLRRAELLSLREEFAALVRPGILRVPRGTIFHIPPGNVDTIFVYSWTLALLTGNRNVVRVSPRHSPQTLILCRLLRRILDGRDLGQVFVEYGHDPAVTAALSQACDVRVVWGGDGTIRAIREFPLPVHAKELTFPDRYSLSAISAAAWLSASDEERDRVVQQFYNDVFWFDQVACSSPRLLVWCGSESDCSRASAGFLPALELEIGARGYRIEPGARMQKELFAARAILDRPVSGHQTYGPQLVVLDLESLENFDRHQCGGGLLFEFRTASLSALAPHIRRQDQTLTHFGFERAELEEFARQLQGRGLDRLVPIGQALRFSRFWDGYDLLEEMTRAVAIG